MAIYEFKPDGISRVDETTFVAVGLRERQDIQRLLREHVEVIAPDTLVISEEFGDWEDSKRRIDLLGIDKSASLVVIELKRTEDGGYMDLQAIRYASMVSTITFDQATDALGRYLNHLGKEEQDPGALILDFLGWDEPDEDQFAQDVHIVLASAEFSKELTSSVMWLIDHDVDIRCVRLKPYSLDDRILVDVQQLIPLPEAAEYQVQVREKARKERSARSSGADFTRYDIRLEDEQHASMWKRNAIFLICRRLCDRGIDPEEIAALFDWRPNRVWYFVDGEVDAVAFEDLAAEKANSNGPSFDSRRWFCREGELIRANNRTFAFSNQWGGKSWLKGMECLKQRYPQLRIDFSPAS